MQRWEYRLVALPAEGNGWSLAALDDAGRDGWQAVGSLRAPARRSSCS